MCLTERLRKIMNCRKLLDYGSDLLAGRGVASPRVDAELLLSHALGCSRLALYTEECSVGVRARQTFRRYILKRAQGRPLHYILGRVSFMGYELKAAEGVFIARPETELLVEAALKRLAECPTRKPLVLDIGTGCGAIAIALTLQNSNCRIKATDISEEAIELARENARALAVHERVDFQNADLFPPGIADVDMIVSNPPYVPRDKMNSLPREVRCEPVLALDGGKEGVSYHVRIIERASGILKSGGWLILELGYDEAPLITREIERAPGLTREEIIRDYNGRDRIITARRR